MTHRTSTFLLAALSLSFVGCPDSSTSEDAASDARALSTIDAYSTTDAHSTTDAYSTTDAAVPEGDTTPLAVAAAEAFLATLTEAQRSTGTFAFDDAAQQVRWSNLPTGLFSRAGLRWADMTSAQHTALMNLLATILSPAGLQQVRATVAADEALRASSGGGMLTFGQDEYFTAIMGTPSTTTPWRVQFGGHHLAINATIVGSNITLAPSLTGAQPTSVTLDGAITRAQGAELDAAFAMVASLDASQQATAIIGASFIDLVLGPGQDGRVLTPEGLRASAMTAEQRTLLVALIRTRVGILNDEDAALRMAQIESTLDDTYFAWSGPTATGSAAYFRVTGPTLAIEYSPQSLGGSATDHTHAMYRDPTNDYGVAFPR